MGASCSPTCASRLPACPRSCHQTLLWGSQLLPNPESGSAATPAHTPQHTRVTQQPWVNNGHTQSQPLSMNYSMSLQELKTTERPAGPLPGKSLADLHSCPLSMPPCHLELPSVSPPTVHIPTYYIVGHGLFHCEVARVNLPAVRTCTGHNRTTPQHQPACDTHHVSCWQQQAATALDTLHLASIAVWGLQHSPKGCDSP